ncbi:hypothetical protein DEU56DRAFT_945707 [Suillus clintonianus]|uniref:uncharacterized protein n=1 Tax=Suillus clintonianus TaxID=1904413 RepID=UPI001B883CD1|nr:uncharacterized protein DEU56DRAFT_945707 [Suillus clintonianus]KAG2137972.1 hypothetical protein DEU56DRAFT_945707 [Suillus clintonianus]
MGAAALFKGDTMLEVCTVLANSGNDVNKVRKAVMLYIAQKKQKGRSEQDIQEKLLQLEDKFKHIEAWHPAFQDARALFQLPRSKHIPLPKSVISEQEEIELLSAIATGLLPPSLKLPSTPVCSSPAPSSWDGPPPGLQDLPYVLPSFSWEDHSLKSRARTPSSPEPGQIISSNMILMLSHYGDSEGDD